MKLEKWLEKQGLTQAQFADLIECRQQTVSRYVNGLQIPHRMIMERITAATNGEVDPRDFYRAAPEREAA